VTPFLGLSLLFLVSPHCELSGATLPVRLLGFPESRVESKDAQESFPALGGRGSALIQAFLPITCCFVLANDSLMQNEETMTGIRTGIQSLLLSY